MGSGDTRTEQMLYVLGNGGTSDQFNGCCNTKITDNTLISQLNTVHQFLTRYGYNSIVSGNLPLIISKTNL